MATWDKDYMSQDPLQLRELIRLPLNQEVSWKEKASSFLLVEMQSNGHHCRNSLGPPKRPQRWKYPQQSNKTGGDWVTNTVGHNIRPGLLVDRAFSTNLSHCSLGFLLFGVELNHVMPDLSTWSREVLRRWRKTQGKFVERVLAAYTNNSLHSRVYPMNLLPSLTSWG